MARGLRFFLALVLGVGGLVFTVSGFALVILGGENGADPYAQIGDHKFGPDSVGGAGIALGLVALLFSVLIIRSRPRD